MNQIAHHKLFDLPFQGAVSAARLTDLLFSLLLRLLPLRGMQLTMPRRGPESTPQLEQHPNRQN